MPEKDAKKQVPLRIGSKLYAELAEWAEDDFRSLNGQIEYLLTECVKAHRKTGGLPKSFEKEDGGESGGKLDENH